MIFTIKSLSDSLKPWTTLNFLYLNDGSGYACAGQASANDSPPILSKVPIDFDSEENLGAAPPIGSDAIKGSIVLH